jgi:hypothetical protein
MAPDENPSPSVSMTAVWHVITLLEFCGALISLGHFGVFGGTFDPFYILFIYYLL